MITRVTTTDELESIFAEALINRTNGKVTKISPGSVLSGHTYGVAKIAQKALKDIAIANAHLFPDFASGIYLDKVAAERGIAPRFGASQSSTFVRVFADPATVYTAGTNTFVSRTGVVFDIENTTTVGPTGFAFIKVRSQTSGLSANADPLTIDTVNPVPTGHTAVLNEYQATGGRDIEDDNTFRIRIKEGANILARHTLSYLEQALMRVNQNVLRVHFQGFDDEGKIVLAILTQNGIDLNQSELDELFDKVGEFLAITDILYPRDQTYGVTFKNIEYEPIDIDFRVLLDDSFNPDDVRKQIQVAMGKNLDFRFWEFGREVEWDDLFIIARTTAGVRIVPDEYFTPNVDMLIPDTRVPRIRTFIMRDLEGNIISDVSGVQNPIYYSTTPDQSFAETVIQNP